MYTISAIGHCRTVHKELKGMPIQPKGAKGLTAEVVMKDEFAEGLKSVDTFSHIYLIYILHEVKEEKLTVAPFMEKRKDSDGNFLKHGIFSTRSPARPNRIGMSVVEVVGVKDNILTISGADMLDGTPVIDIKPYIAAFDEVKESKSGWMVSEVSEVAEKRSDDRFL